MIPIKILAIGAGGLQRALTHEFIHILNQRNLYNGGIFVGQPRGAEKADAFNQQGSVYHVVTFDLSGIHDIRKVSSVVGATTLATEAGREQFYAQTENPLDLLLIGVTEAGIAKGELAMDVLDETLYRYFCHHGANATLCVINTDNLRNNGDVIRDILCNEYPKRSDDYAAWLETNVGFLNEMGDRLVPQVYAVPDEIQEAARAQIEGQDELITYAEAPPATPLILEDLENMLRVPFAELQDYGVIVSQESIEPYHDWKLLLVNSVHVPGITHKGTLSGIEYVNEAATHPKFAPHLERLMDGYAEIVEADIPIVGKSARAYSLEFVERIRRVKDDNARINIIETVKLRERAADIVRSPNYDASTELFKNDFAYSFATVLRFLTPGSPPVTGKGGSSPVTGKGGAPPVTGKGGSPPVTGKGGAPPVTGKGGAPPVTGKGHTTSGDDYRGITDTGAEYEIRDPNRTIQDILKGAFGANRTDVEKRILTILSNAMLWSPAGTSSPSGLDGNQDFTERVAGYYHRLVNGETCLKVLESINVE